jgi:hypothetical protein
MGKKFCLVGLLFIIAGTVAAPAAMAYNQTITVYATVLPQRVVHIDGSGNITRVAGNTADNIEPRVTDENNHPSAITDSIRQQYQRFLESHGNHLEAGKIYTVNPVSISPAPNTQVIEINSTNLTLGSLNID